jgi:hypothetical protein
MASKTRRAAISKKVQPTGFEPVPEKDRDLPEGSPEVTRRTNNRRRDKKSQLGLGKSSTVVVE